MSKTVSEVIRLLQQCEPTSFFEVRDSNSGANYEVNAILKGKNSGKVFAAIAIDQGEDFDEESERRQAEEDADDESDDS